MRVESDLKQAKRAELRGDIQTQRQATLQAYSKMRSIWERLVPKHLLKDVVRPFGGKLNLRNLKCVEVSDEDFFTINRYHSRCSELIDAHDHPEGDLPMASVAEAQADLAALCLYDDLLRERQAGARKRRDLRTGAGAGSLG